MLGKYVGEFEIPEEIAKKLSDLLTQQTIRERLLIQLINTDDGSYNKVESSLMPIINEIESIKYNITNEYVPVVFRSEKYTWNYDGYTISENKVQVYENA